jgi:hypothetical protein
MTYRCLLLLALVAACDDTPKRWIYLVNSSNVPVKVVFRERPNEEAHLHEIGPRDILSRAFPVGEYHISTFDAAGKAHATPIRVDRPSTHGEIDQLWFDVSGGARYLLVNCSSLYSGNALTESIRQELTKGTSKVRQYDGDKPFEVRLRGQVELVDPFTAIPRETHLGTSIWKLVVVDKQLPPEEAVKVAMQELSKRK